MTEPEQSKENDVVAFEDAEDEDDVEVEEIVELLLVIEKPRLGVFL